MNCKMCHSQAISAFPADVRFYVNGSRTMSTPPMNPGPQVQVCLSCGNSEFTVPPAWLSSGWLKPMGVPAFTTGLTPQHQE